MTCCERTLVTLACAAGLCQPEGHGVIDEPRHVLKSHFVTPPICEDCIESCVRVLAELQEGALLANGNRAIAREYVATYRRVCG